MITTVGNASKKSLEKSSISCINRKNTSQWEQGLEEVSYFMAHQGQARQC